MSKRAIVHVEIPAKDRHTSGKFYSDLFGWELSDMPEMDYMTFMSGSVGGGFNPVGDFPEMGMSIKPDDVLIYIASDDIEADLARITEHGGKALTGKTEIPNAGWFAMFLDPTGNRLALFEERGE